MIEINLLPWRQFIRDKAKRRLKTQVLLMIISVACIFSIWNYFVVSELEGQKRCNQRLNMEISDFKKQVEMVEKLKKVRQALIKKIDLIQKFYIARALTVRLLDELPILLPTGVYITKIERIENTITILGYSITNEQISHLLTRLKKVTWTQDLVLIEIKKAKNEILNEFLLRFKLIK